jgi:hypothetical protein
MQTKVVEAVRGAQASAVPGQVQLAIGREIIDPLPLPHYPLMSAP